MFLLRVAVVAIVATPIAVAFVAGVRWLYG